MYSVSTIIIAITALATFMGLSNVAFFDRFKFSISKIKSGEQFRMITSGFYMPIGFILLLICLVFGVLPIF